MKEVIPKEKLLYLPYSKKIVSTVYFDASREVFTSLLSCPTMNQDENFSFYGSRQACAPRGYRHKQCRKISRQWQTLKAVSGTLKAERQPEMHHLPLLSPGAEKQVNCG